jgi:tetratricopeptide (TPR) repeat protein
MIAINNKEINFLTLFPDEIKKEMFSYLPDKDLMQTLPVVCKAFKHLTTVEMDIEWKKRTIKLLGKEEGEDFFLRQKLPSWRATYLAFKRLSICDYAEILHSRGNYKKAALKYSEALNLQPQNVIALIGRARILLRWAKFKEAQVHFERAFELGFLNINALKEYATTLLCLGKYEEAKQKFNEALRIQS